MASIIKKYKIGPAKIGRGLLEGFELSPEGNLAAAAEYTGPRRLFLRAIDGGETDCQWGRLVFHARVGEDTVYALSAFAGNNRDFVSNGRVTNIDNFLLDTQIPSVHKITLFRESGASSFSDSGDVLLYGQKGRYLWLCLEARGDAAEFSDFRLYVPGDNFFQTFPEVYRQNGDFFHRYISIFSTLYNDLQDTIDGIDSLLDIDTAPSGLLPVYAGWLGLELDGDFLEDAQFRQLLKIAFSLIKGKGTRRALEQIIGIFISEPFYIVERRLVQDSINSANRHALESLYGDDMFCFTVLINRPEDEKLHLRLMFLLNQFKPLRTRARIVFMGDTSAMDDGCYLDINASVVKMTAARLDERCVINGKTMIS